MKTNFDALDISTRPKRRRMIERIIKCLNDVRNMEEGYRDRIPDNLSNSDAYADAELSIELIDDAIGSLIDAY